MVRRRRRSDGAEFWGCPRYPECRGTRPLSAIDATRGRDEPLSSAGSAGDSARAQFERRSARHRDDIERRRPRIIATSTVIVVAGIALAAGTFGPSWRLLGAATITLGVVSALVSLFVLPNSVRAWETGAAGEVETARILEPLAQEGFVVLHDRRVANRRENIDHVVIGAPGVFVVETKNYGGNLRVRGRDLYVNGRRRTGIVDQVTRQADAVAAVLGVPVGRIIVVHRAEFPLLRAQSLDGVPILEPRGLVSFLRKSSPVLTSIEVARLANLASDGLRSAT